MDFTGTGNSLNPVHPSVLRLIMDSLRYWAIECHVDGFRFDLASALARELYDVDRLSSFFDVIHQDPVLSQVKLIAEPWDVGPGGYQVGNFPVLWAEWNGKYRDCVRDFWRGHASLGELASRFTGSSDLYESDGRRPSASINFVTCHDGFTLADLVSYNEKHNEANGEDGRDGTDDNRSLELRRRGADRAIRLCSSCGERQQRNFLATLFLSQGVPMLLGGDELGRTQRGNNNALVPGQRDLSGSTGAPTPAGERLLAVHAPADRACAATTPSSAARTSSSAARRTARAYPTSGGSARTAAGMTNADWQSGGDDARCLPQRAGDTRPHAGRRRRVIEDDSFLVLLNGGGEDVTLSSAGRPLRPALGARAVDRRPRRRRGRPCGHRADVPLGARSLLLLRRI